MDRRGAIYGITVDPVGSTPPPTVYRIVPQPLR